MLMNVHWGCGSLSSCSLPVRSANKNNLFTSIVGGLAV